jgi:hypothetical protein
MKTNSIESNSIKMSFDEKSFDEKSFDEKGATGRGGGGAARTIFDQHFTSNSSLAFDVQTQLWGYRVTTRVCKETALSFIAVYLDHSQTPDDHEKLGS